MEQFEQLLTCAICLDRYRNPKLLPCQHSFCMEPCMDGLVDYVRRQVKCPECRAEHRIPYQGVQAFPTNVTLQRFLELHIEITGELPDPTSGQTMERCGVCSEKSYCSLCVHCEKKCCPECKDAHMDILRREITRINSQIRRGLHRLQDALALVEKNTLGLQTNCASVTEEVDEIYRRLSKALKDRTEHLRNEVDRYLSTELRGLIQLKENLELEIANIQSNCDLAEAHINENVPWDDSELLDTKELFLRTVEFIRNFEYEAGDYSRRVRFVMAHDPNQLVLHVAGYGELNIKPETGSGGLLGSSSSLVPPGGSPGLMRSKSDHRLASQYRQQEEERLARNRYVPEYDYHLHRYDAPEYEAPRNKSRYRSRFMRHRDGDDSDGDTRSTVRFTSTPQDSSGLRERVLDTEDAARGPLSGIFRLTDSPRVMRKLQEYERAGKRKKEEPATHPVQPQPPKPQVQVRKVPTAMARQTSEDDEISRIKKQNKTAAAPATETVEERQPATTPAHPLPRDAPPERDPEETARRPMTARRTSTDTHTPATRSASSDSSTGSESSGGSGIRSTGAPFTAEEMKQKYLSRAPTSNTTSTAQPAQVASTPAKDSGTASPASRSFQSRFLGTGNRAAPPPPAQSPATREDSSMKKKEDEEDEDEETSSSSEETESETEEESENEAHTTTNTSSTTPSTAQDRQRSEQAMARTDIGPLLARSAEARRGSKEDSPSTRYSSPRGSPAHSVNTSPTTTTSTSTSTTTGTGGGGGVATLATPAGYTSRFVAHVAHGRQTADHQASSNSNNPHDRNRFRTFRDEHDEPPSATGPRGAIIATERTSADTRVIVDANRPESSLIKHNRTDDSTDTDGTTQSSSSSSFFLATRPEGLEGSGHVSRVAEGRSVNDVSSSLHARSDPQKSTSDQTLVKSNHKDQPARTSTLERLLEVPTEERGSRESSSYSTSTNSETESDSETASETDEEEDQSRDENSNFKIKKISSLDKDGDRDKNGKPEDVSTESEESTDTETDDETTVLSVRADPRSQEDRRQDRYDEVKRRSSSIIGEKSIEELFDDNGWVITDQDLQADGPRRMSRSFELIDGDQKDTEAKEQNTEKLKDKLEDDDDTSEGAKTLSLSESSESLPRSRVYRQSSLGKNGWMVSDESDSENDRGGAEENAKKTTDGGSKVSSNLEKEGKKEDGAWNIDENGWVIVNRIKDMEDNKGVQDETRSTIRSQTTDLAVRASTENGALVANATQSKETESPAEHEDTPGVAISIPMQMVTTVFCVSVLCYSVLINLFL